MCTFWSFLNMSKDLIKHIKCTNILDFSPYSHHTVTLSHHTVILQFIWQDMSLKIIQNFDIILSYNQDLTLPISVTSNTVDKRINYIQHIIKILISWRISEFQKLPRITRKKVFRFWTVDSWPKGMGFSYNFIIAMQSRKM